VTLYPDIDEDSAPYWAAAREHRLVIQRCSSCSTARFPARPICAVCASTDFDWIEDPGRAHLISWCIVRHSFHPEFANVPYAVLLVELDAHAGVAMFGGFHGDLDGLEANLALSAVFDDVAAGLTLVNWVAAQAPVRGGRSHET
jgi:uncharacterized OB-fold protein